MVAILGFCGSKQNFQFHSFLSLAFPAVSPLITLINIPTRLLLLLLSPPEPTNDLPTDLLQPPSKIIPLPNLCKSTYLLLPKAPTTVLSSSYYVYTRIQYYVEILVNYA